jgi:hypothetical protein
LAIKTDRVANFSLAHLHELKNNSIIYIPFVINKKNLFIAKERLKKNSPLID